MAHEPEFVGIWVFLPSASFFRADPKYDGEIGLRENFERLPGMHEHFVDFGAFHNVPKFAARWQASD
jgi:hypothetical protein